MRLLRSIVVGVMFILTSFLLCPLSAQTTGAEGVVKDATTGETLPSVQVYFTGTTIGSITDLDGNYSIENTHDVEGHLNVSGIHILVL